LAQAEGSLVDLVVFVCVYVCDSVCQFPSSSVALVANPIVS